MTKESIRGFRKGQTGIGFDHREITKDIKVGLRKANKTINTAERFGNKTIYNSAEVKLRHARDDINSIQQYHVSRRSALRHAIGFETDHLGARATSAKNPKIGFDGRSPDYRMGNPKYAFETRTEGGTKFLTLPSGYPGKIRVYSNEGRFLGYASSGKLHPPGCNCPFHGGHPAKMPPAARGIGRKGI